MFQMKPFQTYVEHLSELCLLVQSPPGLIISGAAADSRKICEGWIFCAIPGASQDGTNFVQQALQAGAAAIVSTRKLPVPTNVGFVQVSDAYVAAARLAEVSYDFPARQLQLIGVTGTNGKTTCAFLLRDILRHCSRRAGMIGTVEYSLGSHTLAAERTTPMPFQYQQLLREMVQEGLDSAVVEVSSHALVQRRAGTVPMAAALFTNLSGDHLDYHHTFEEYYGAKKILFSDYLASAAPAVINCDDPYGRRLLKELQLAHVKTVSYGTAAQADWRVQDVELAVSGTAFTLRNAAAEIRLQTPMIGNHNVMNAAGAAALALTLDLPKEMIVTAIAGCRGAPGRLERVDAANGFSAFVDYAHTDDALCNVLKALRELQPKRLTVIFGCGGDRDRTKRARMGRVAVALADRVIVTSDNPRTEDPATIIAEICEGIAPDADLDCISDRRRAIATAVREARQGDIILIAGKGHETYQEVQGQKFPFDDLQEVHQAIASRGP